MANFNVRYECHNARDEIRKARSKGSRDFDGLPRNILDSLDNHEDYDPAQDYSDHYLGNGAEKESEKSDGKKTVGREAEMEEMSKVLKRIGLESGASPEANGPIYSIGRTDSVCTSPSLGSGFAEREVGALESQGISYCPYVRSSKRIQIV